MTLVAVMASNEEEGNGQIVGFADMDSAGYLDRLYVHKDFQRHGIASELCDRLEQAVDAETITTHASITARPFFEKRGYKVVREQQVERKGVLLTNYVMKRLQFTPYSGIGECSVMLACKKHSPIPEGEWNSQPPPT